MRLILTQNKASENDVEWNLEYVTYELGAAGFEILEGNKDTTLTRIFDVGVIAFYLKAIPWDFPDFTVEKYYNKLVEINKIINDNGYLDVDMNTHRFIIKAKKSKK